MTENNYLTKSLDDFLDLSTTLKQYRNRFISELIHSSFLVANDKSHRIMTMSLDGKRYAFIFTDEDEFRKAFPNENVSSTSLEFATLKSVLNGFKLDGFILNVSGQNLYLEKEFINDLRYVPSDTIDSSEAYSQEELQSLKGSIDNGDLEEFLKSPEGFPELIRTMSSNPLFGLVISDSDMDILEEGGMIETMGLFDKYDFYNHNGHVALFTSERGLGNVETPKFRYLSLVDFALVAHHSIRHELKGIVINPNVENYIIPTEMLIENWSLISRLCHNERLVSGRHYLFVID